MKTFFSLGVLFTITGTLLFYSCKKTVVPGPANPSTPLYALIIGDTSLSVFNAAIQKAGDSVLFHGIDSITVLFPTNTALLAEGISMGTINALPAKSLDSIVRYHYISGAVNLADSLYIPFNSLLGPPVYGYGSTDSTSSYFNGVPAVLQTLRGSNALVYILNTPLHIPAASITQLLSADTSLTYFAEAVTHTNISLVPASGWNTILAPDNNAFITAGFATLADIDNADVTSLTNVLQYHVLPGQYFSNNFLTFSTVTTANANAIGISLNNGFAQFTGTADTTAASITQADRIAGSNIIVQKINAVLKQ